MDSTVRTHTNDVNNTNQITMEKANTGRHVYSAHNQIGLYVVALHMNNVDTCRVMVCAGVYWCISMLVFSFFYVSHVCQNIGVKLFVFHSWLHQQSNTEIYSFIDTSEETPKHTKALPEKLSFFYLLFPNKKRKNNSPIDVYEIYGSNTVSGCVFMVKLVFQI